MHQLKAPTSQIVSSVTVNLQCSQFALLPLLCMYFTQCFQIKVQVPTVLSSWETSRHIFINHLRSKQLICISVNKMQCLNERLKLHLVQFDSLYSVSSENTYVSFHSLYFLLRFNHVHSLCKVLRSLQRTLKKIKCTFPFHLVRLFFSPLPPPKSFSKQQHSTKFCSV